MDHVILLFGLVVDTCIYITRFNILMSYTSDKNKVEMMLKKECRGIQGQRKKFAWTEV